MNHIFRLAADTRSTPKRMAAISGISLRLLVEISDSDITVGKGSARVKFRGRKERAFVDLRSGQEMSSKVKEQRE